MARTFDAGSTVGTTATVLFQSNRNKLGLAGDGEPFRSVNFDVAAASAVALQVNIPAIHGSGNYYTIPVGTSKEFVAIGGGTEPRGDTITIKGNGGTATYSGGITG